MASTRFSIIRYGNTYGLLLIILLAVAIILAGVMEYEFLVWDDNRIIHELQSRSDSPGAFFTWLTNNHVTTIFTPVSVLFFGLLADVFGIEPLPFHAAGVLLHLLNTFLVYLLILRLFALQPTYQKSAFPMLEPLVAALSAGLWGMHLLRAEVIGWVAALPYALSTALALLAVHAFISADRTSATRPGVWISLTLYSFSILAHPQSAALCIVFFALDYLLASKEISCNLQERQLIIHFAKRNAVFLLTGLFVTYIVITHSPAESVAPSEAVQLLATFLGVVSDFFLPHTWLPQHVSLAYSPYVLTELFSGSLLLSLLFFSVIVFIGIWRWLVGKRGLLLAIVCHMVFCMLAASSAIPSDRYSYALAIIAVFPMAYALRSSGEFAARRLGSSVTPNMLGIGMAGITIMLLVVCLSKLTAALPDWKNTHALMVHFQNTAPSREWYFLAKLRDVDYLRMKGDIPQMKQVLLSFLEAPRGKEGETLSYATQYLIAQGRCAEAYYLIQSADAQLVRTNAVQVNNLLRSCR